MDDRNPPDNRSLIVIMVAVALALAMIGVVAGLLVF